MRTRPLPPVLIGSAQDACGPVGWEKDDLKAWGHAPVFLASMERINIEVRLQLADLAALIAADHSTIATDLAKLLPCRLLN